MHEAIMGEFISIATIYSPSWVQNIDVVHYHWVHLPWWPWNYIKVIPLLFSTPKILNTTEFRYSLYFKDWKAVLFYQRLSFGRPRLPHRVLSLIWLVKCRLAAFYLETILEWNTSEFWAMVDMYYAGRAFEILKVDSLVLICFICPWLS